VTEIDAADSEPRTSPANSDCLAIQIEKVSKIFSKRQWLGLRSCSDMSVTALREVSLTVREGEMVGLLGPNGAGKTTLLKSVAGLLEVTSGTIKVHGLDLNANPVAVRRMMGLVTCDERSFYWRLSGRRNLRFFGALYRVPEKVLNNRIDLLLEKLDLSTAADRPYHTYSTGMRQKLAIARGLLAEPRLVLYDEPTRSLDPLSAQNIRNWIKASRQVFPNTTHLIATNQLHEAEQLCDRVVIVNQGKVIADGAIDRIREKFHSSSRLVHRIACMRRVAGHALRTPKSGCSRSIRRTGTPARSHTVL
jgi:ABC-2 type transport system ATP-binding protein